MNAALAKSERKKFILINCYKQKGCENYQGSTFFRSYLKTLSVGPVGVSNTRPPASQPGAPLSGQPMRTNTS